MIPFALSCHLWQTNPFPIFRNFRPMADLDVNVISPTGWDGKIRISHLVTFNMDRMLGAIGEDSAHIMENGGECIVVCDTAANAELIKGFFCGSTDSPGVCLHAPDNFEAPSEKRRIGKYNGRGVRVFVVTLETLKSLTNVYGENNGWLRRAALLITVNLDQTTAEDEAMRKLLCRRNENGIALTIEHWICNVQSKEKRAEDQRNYDLLVNGMQSAAIRRT